MEKKKSEIGWFSAIFLPILWGVSFWRFHETGCFRISPMQPICEDQAVLVLVPWFLFCFSFPAVFIYRRFLASSDKNK